MSTLTNEEHTMLKVLRDMSPESQVKEAIEKLLRICNGRYDDISKADMELRLERAERGIEHVIQIMAMGLSARECAEPTGEMPPELVFYTVVHLQNALDALNGKEIREFEDVGSEVLLERFKVDKAQVDAGTKATKDHLKSIGKKSEADCPDPFCRRHRKWWFAS